MKSTDQPRWSNTHACRKETPCSSPPVFSTSAASSSSETKKFHVFPNIQLFPGDQRDPWIFGTQPYCAVWVNHAFWTHHGRYTPFNQQNTAVWRENGLPNLATQGADCWEGAQAAGKRRLCMYVYIYRYACSISMVRMFFKYSSIWVLYMLNYKLICV